jgi:hypothetical protein
LADRLPGSRRAGLIWCIDGGEITALTDDKATIHMFNGEFEEFIRDDSHSMLEPIGTM